MPAPSAVVRSGQGLWLFWLLHDEADKSRARLGAYADNLRNHLQLYARINREIGRRLAELGADPVATDAARYVRVPGSFRNDVEEEVRWQWEDPSGETVLSYSLLDLGERLGVNKTTARKPAPQTQSAGKHPLRRHGFIAANANKLAAFQSLQGLRDGFAEGKRHCCFHLRGVAEMGRTFTVGSDSGTGGIRAHMSPAIPSSGMPQRGQECLQEKGSNDALLLDRRPARRDAV